MTTDDDTLLRVGMGRLEIEPIKVVKTTKEENPFTNPLQKKPFSAKTYIQNNKCHCLVQKKKNVSVYKKKQNKLLKEPVLRLSYGNSSLKTECQQFFSNDSLLRHSSQKIYSDNLSLHSLVDNCNQLSISNKKNQTCLRISKSNSCAKWWKCETTSERQSRDLTDRSSSCSQQALNPPCDITIDELASYFETLVHIPKKMSSMAEMMYI